MAPEKFERGDVEEFLYHFRQTTKWNRWNSEEEAIQLSMALKGPARQVLMGLAPYDQHDPGMIKRAL